MKMLVAISLCIVLVLATITPTYASIQTAKVKSHTIFIIGCSTKGSCFYPCQITIATGDIVTWVNRDSASHMIISGSGQGGPDGWFTSPVIFSHGTYSHVFDRKGPFTYYDLTNTYAQGVVIVDSSIHSDFVKLHQSYYSDWWCTR